MHWRLPFVWFLAALAAVAVCAPGRAVSSAFAERDGSVLVRGTELERIVARDFTRYDPDYPRRMESYGRRLHALAGRLAEAQAEGNEMACSTQIFQEAKWLYHYTADWARLERHLARLAGSLEDPDQAFALRQSAEDGLWGVCYEEWFLRAGATFEALEDYYDQGKVPEHPIRNVNRLRALPEIDAYLESLLISDVAATGRDNRAELASITTVLTATSFKAYLKDFLAREVARIPTDGPPYSLETFTEDYERILSMWQDPQTGYWGAWYRSDGQVYRTTDLSITYHTVAYRQGDVAHWPQIIATTFDIRDEPYPFGWSYRGGPNNHNNYDVARIFRLGWPHMSEAERARAREEIRRMLDWTLTDSLAPNGRFKVDPTFFDSLAAEYYYGVSFLDQIGYWDEERRFWTDEDFPDAAARCHLITKSLTEMRFDQWEARETMRRLERNCPKPVR